MCIKIFNVSAYVYMHLRHTYMYKRMCIHTNVHTYIHTYVHTYIHTRVKNSIANPRENPVPRDRIPSCVFPLNSRWNLIFENKQYPAGLNG